MQNSFYGRFVKADPRGRLPGAAVRVALAGAGHGAALLQPAVGLPGGLDRPAQLLRRRFADTMLAQPGSGYLGSGLQQVADRPFGISEWIHVYPSLYSAEGPAIFAAYGMGLQGWDSSYEFQSSSGHGAGARSWATSPGACGTPTRPRRSASPRSGADGDAAATFARSGSSPRGS